MHRDRKQPSQLRKDPIQERWVIISTVRSQRPHDWVAEPITRNNGVCPFCAGNEQQTPPEIAAIRADGAKTDAPGWTVRVVSNKFPALEIEDQLDYRRQGMFEMMNGIGAHEVIIETPDHFVELADLPIHHIRDIFWTFRQRIVALKKDARFKYILVFKNHGREAGASLQHSHSQLIALPIIPKTVMEELRGVQQYFRQYKRCIFCEIIRQEIQLSSRLVASNADYIVLEPFAARFPYETWVLPIHHQRNFEHISYDACYNLAAIMKLILTRLNRALENPPYNFVIHTFPLQDQQFTDYHWHIEIIPKLSNVAGFEWGSGFYINTHPPEQAAQVLRDMQ